MNKKIEVSDERILCVEVFKDCGNPKGGLKMSQ